MKNFMLTVTELARRCSLSRSTILYYESVELLFPAHRSDNGYRWYSDTEVQRLEAIAAYRSYGLSLENIKELLNNQHNSSQSEILKDHFYQLEKRIHTLKEQQTAIVDLLQKPDLLSSQGVTKERWVAIMKASGFDESAMRAWHQNFEKMEPEEHLKFLESLGIDEDEIREIRSC